MTLIDFKNPLVFLAPMAGLSDAPMRSCVAQFGVDAVVSEMIASQEWKTERRSALDRAVRATDQGLGDTVFITQIAGRDPALMADVARFAVDNGADQIDINMGCPAKKVNAGATGGAALLLDEPLALEIVDSVSRAVDLPVSVKTRLGWDAYTTVDLAPRLVNAGAQMLTIHGRTRAQKYDGQADWDAVAAIKNAVNVPVIVNGDIIDIDSAKLALRQSGADGVMIGRAAAGQPHLPSNIRDALRGAQPKAKLEHTNIITHYTDIISFYGRDLGVRNARKHLNAYFASSPRDWLSGLLREACPDAVMDAIISAEYSHA